MQPNSDAVVAERPERRIKPEEVSPALPSVKVFWYCLANLGYGAFYSLNNAVIPLFLEGFTKNAVILGLMGSSHSVEGAVIQPVVGSLSDRLRTRLGRRLPFMLLFIPLSAGILALTPLTSNLSGPLRLPLVLIAIFLFTVLFNIAFDPYKALMPDITPERQRGRVTSIWTLLGVLGQAGILLAPLSSAIKFPLVAVLMIVTTTLTCASISEPLAPELTDERKSHLHEIKEAVWGLRTLVQARKGILAFFLSGIGIGAVLPYLTLFVKRVTGCSDHQAELMFLVLMISTAAAVLPFGWLADRIGPKRVLFIGLTLIGLAALNGLWIVNLTQVAVVLAIAGAGNAAQSAASYPFLTELVPGEEVGFYTGLQTTALSVAQPLTIVITGTMINHGSYRAIFGVCALGMLAALFVLARINRNKAKSEIARRDAEQGRSRGFAVTHV